MADQGSGINNLKTELIPIFIVSQSRVIRIGFICANPSIARPGVGDIDKCIKLAISITYIHYILQYIRIQSNLTREVQRLSNRNGLAIMNYISTSLIY